ncbi:MAG: 3-deoxy-D-manno-octulosonic acid transferase [candidate division NC10 bacterium]|nr:3-deoxy-D-manno-octulosonic acid transferase [candidate division NC10 bacterium]MBI2562623.1 3-deoxy-D-manno-octulosonic acid transferase [candidate division NC10 bacterium]
MMYWLYSLGLGAFFVGGLPVFMAQAILRGKYRRGLPERLGRVPAWAGPVPPVWLHAVSVGEVMAAIPLARELAGRRPDLPLLVSTVTDTGRNVAEQRLPGKQFVFFPVDLGWAVEPALDRLRPRIVLLTETEIWPNFIRACGARGVPVVLINGRISPRSYPRYRRVRRLFAQVLRGIRLFCMQTPEDAGRILDLGAPAERVHVVGNLKFDLAVTGDPQDGSAVRRMLGLPPSRPVLVAGSTHRGEEAPVLEAFHAVRSAVPDITLLLAPRHPERLGEVETLLERTGVAWSRRSRLPASQPPPVILVDTMGELARLYAAGTVVFVGGSLVPIGGHNVLEPAAYARPVLFGPHMGNFAEMARLFLEQGAAIQVMNADGLAAEILRLLQEPRLAGRMGEAGRGIVETHRGAGRRTLDLLEALL